MNISWIFFFFLFVAIFSHHIGTLLLTLVRFTLYILVSYCPGLIGVKVCVSAHTRTWEVGVSQESSLSIKGRAVAMKTWGKEDHDVWLFATAIFHLLVWDLVECQWGNLLPDFKSLSDGFKWVILSDLRSVVLDTVIKRGEKKKIKPRDCILIQ